MSEQTIKKIFLLERDILIHEMQYLLECQNKIIPIDEESREMLDFLKKAMTKKQKELNKL